MQKTLHVKFSETRVVKDREARRFEAGGIYELPESSALRWVRRRVAEVVDPKQPEPVVDQVEAPSPRRNGRKPKGD